MSCEMAKLDSIVSVADYGVLIQARFNSGFLSQVEIAKPVRQLLDGMIFSSGVKLCN